MKAITIRQPWASLVALGVKTVETRSWHTRYRGPLAIHAGLQTLAKGHSAEIGEWLYRPSNQYGWELWPPNTHNEFEGFERCCLKMIAPTFGAVVATCELADVVPIVWYGSARRGSMYYVDWEKEGIWYANADLPLDGRAEDYSDQLPFGDFTPGRYAWMLKDIRSVADRCPLCWGEGSWPSFTMQVCPLCRGTRGVASHVPARGRQGLWNWEPES